MAKLSTLAKLGSLGARSAYRPATRYARDPRKLADLLGRAKAKADREQGPMADVWDELMLLLRLLRAYLNGSYREVPWQSLLRITAAIVYFVMPIDLIPDVIAGVGLVDDVAVIVWTVRSIRSDLERFRAWENNQVADAEAQH